MADTTPFSITELQASPEYQQADPATRTTYLNNNQEQWRQHLRDDFGPVTDEAYWQSLNDVEAAHAQARQGEIVTNAANAIKDGKLTEDQWKRYASIGPDAFANEDGEAARFIETFAPKDALTGPYMKQTLPMQGSDGRSVGTMWVRGGKDGAEVAYRINDTEDAKIGSDGTGMLVRTREDGSPSRDVYGVWQLDKTHPELIDESKKKIAANESNKGLQQQALIRVAAGEQTDTSGVFAEARGSLEGIIGNLDAQSAAERAKINQYKNPDTGMIMAGADKFLDFAKENLADKIPQAGLVSRIGGEMAKGILTSGVTVANMGFLFGDREDGEDIRRGLEDISQIGGRRQAGFEGGFVNEASNSILRELPNVTLTMGTGLAASGARGVATAAVTDALAAGAEGVAAKTVAGRVASALPTSTLESLAGGNLGKIIGTNEIESRLGKEVADRVAQSFASLPSTVRSAYDGWVTTVDQASALRKEGKTEEANKLEENATLNAWAGLAIETASENIWLNEMIHTRAGRKLADVGTDVLTRKLGLEGIEKFKDRMGTAVRGALKAGNEEGIEEVVSGIASRAWMNSFAGQNQDLLDGVGQEYFVGAAMGALMGTAKELVNDGRPELLEELMSRAVQADPKAAAIIDETMKKVKADGDPAIDAGTVARSVPAQDRMDVDTINDVIQYVDDNGVPQVILNDNRIEKSEAGKFTLADPGFEQEFDTREDAEQFAAVRHQISFTDKLTESLQSKGAPAEEIEATAGLIDKMYDTAARNAGIRKDAIYKRVLLEDAPAAEATAQEVADEIPPEPTESTEDPASVAQAVVDESVAAADSSPTLLQNQDTATNTGPRGTYNNIENGARGLIRAFQNADPSTYLHEAFHSMQWLDIGGKSLLDHALGGQGGQFWEWATNGGAVQRDSVDALERGAKGLEAYLHEGIAPTPELTGAFAKIAAVFRSIYNTIKDLGVKLTPQARQAYDALFSSEDQGLPVVPDTIRATDEGGQITATDIPSRVAASRLRLAEMDRLSPDSALGQSSPVSQIKAPDLLEIAGSYFLAANIDSFDEFQTIAATDPDLAKLDRSQLEWIYGRSSILNRISEQTEDSEYLGGLSDELRTIIQNATAIDPAYLNDLSAEAAKVIAEAGAKFGYANQAKAMAVTLKSARTPKALNAAIEKASAMAGRMAYGKFISEARALQSQLNAYSKGQRTGRNQMAAMATSANQLFAEALSEDSGIDSDIKSAVRDVAKKMADIIAGKKIDAETIAPQISAAMARVARASARSASRQVNDRIRAVREATRGLTKGKQAMITDIKQALAKSKVRLNNAEVRGILNAVSQADTTAEIIAKGNRIAQILSKAYLRGEYSKARGLHEGAKTRLGRGVYGDASDTVIRPFLAVDPTDVPVDVLPAYIAHLEAITDGTKAVAFGDYKASILNVTSIIQQRLIDEAANEPDVTEPDADPDGMKATIRSDAEDALENYLMALDPSTILEEARAEAKQIKWLLDNKSVMDNWSTTDVVALMKSLHNAKFGTIDVFFGKAAGRASVAQIEPSLRVAFEIATRKELGISGTDNLADLTAEQEQAIKLDSMKTFGRMLTGFMADASGTSKSGNKVGLMEGVGQHFMGDFLGISDMLDAWMNHDIYAAGIHAQKAGSAMLEPFTKSYQALEIQGSVRADIEKAADARGGAMDLPFTRKTVRRQQLSGKMVMAYMLQREYEANGNDGSWIRGEMELMTGEARSGRAGLTEATAESQSKIRVVNLIGQFTKGNMSADGIYDILTEPQKKIIRDYDAMKEKTGSQVFYRSLLTRGQLLPMFDKHVHHKTLEARGGLDEAQNTWGQTIAPSPLVNAGDKNKDGPTRPPSSYERMPGIRNVSWDLYDVVTQEITDVALDYRISPLLAALGKAMRNIEFDTRSETTKGIVRTVMNAQAGHMASLAFHNNSEGRVASSVTSFLKNAIVGRTITSVPRATSELVGSAVRWGIQSPVKLARGLQNYATADQRAKWSDLLFKLGATVSVRGNEYSLEGTEARINTMAGGQVEQLLSSPLKWGKDTLGTGGGSKPTNPGLVGWLTSNKLAQANTEAGHMLNSFGDTALAMPVAVGHFMEQYKLITGNDFVIDQVAQMNPDAMRAAAISTDRYIDQNIAPSHASKNALKIQGKSSDNEAIKAMRFVLYGLTGFNRTMMHQSLTKLKVLMGKNAGIRERAEAFRTLAAMGVSAAIYNVMAQAVVQSLKSLGGGKEEEKDMEEFFSGLDDPEYWFRQVTGGFFGNLIGGRGLISRVVMGSGIEGAWKMARTHLYGDYDKYRQNILNAIPAQDILTGEDLKFQDGYRMTTGLAGVGISTMANFANNINYVMDENTPQNGKAIAGMDIAVDMLHTFFQFPSVRDYQKASSGKRAEEERKAKYKERYGKDFAKEKSIRESEAKAFVHTGNATKWQEYYGKLTTDKKEDADKTLKRETALNSAQVLEPEQWRRLASMSDPDVKAAEYKKLYLKAPDKEAFKAERKKMDKAGISVWSDNPASEFRKALRAAGVP